MAVNTTLVNMTNTNLVQGVDTDTDNSFEVLNKYISQDQLMSIVSLTSIVSSSHLVLPNFFQNSQ